MLALGLPSLKKKQQSKKRLYEKNIRDGRQKLSLAAVFVV